MGKRGEPEVMEYGNFKETLVRMAAGQRGRGVGHSLTANISYVLCIHLKVCKAAK